MSQHYEEQFKQAIICAGLTPPESLVPDHKLHRFSKDGNRGNDSGWYVFFADGLGGVFGCWSTGLSEHWRADTGYEWSEAEQTRHREQVAEAIQKRDEDRSLRQEAAKLTAREMWDSASPCVSFPYLTDKQIETHGTRQLFYRSQEVLLLVPMLLNGEIVSLQTINLDGKKKYLSGGRVSGCYYPIGEEAGSQTVCIAEGFATAATVYEATGYPTYCAFNAGNLIKVAQSVRAMHPEAAILICGDDDWQTEGNIGKAKAREAGFAIGAEVLFPVFGADREDGDTDFNDQHVRYGLESVRAVFSSDTNKVEQGGDPQNQPQSDSMGASDTNTSPEPQKLSKAAQEALLERLASMSDLDYEQERQKVASQLGVRVNMLDGMVKKTRKEADSTSGIDFADVEPWDEPVQFNELLDKISGTIRRFIVCDKGTSDAAALWVAMTWVMDIVQVAPLAVITAPEKRCGKSQMLNVLGKMVCRPLQASNISPAALYRVVEGSQPTLMIDETDTFLKDNEDMRGIINSGHTRDSAYVIRTVGDDHTPTRFSTWGAKALSGIGKLADTIMDRSVILQLRRKLPHEKVDRLRHAEPLLFDDLISQIKRCIDDNREAIRLCRPELPEQLNDRAQDNWEPLLAIADVAGGGWSERARAAALCLSDESEAVLPVGTELLHDIHEAFISEAVTKLSTHDLIKSLCKDTEKRWATYNRGKEITATQLAKRLSEYGIKSNDIRFGALGVFKGFRYDQFKDAFARYVARAENVACSGSEESVADADFDGATPKPTPVNDCSGVAAVEGGGAAEKVVVSV